MGAFLALELASKCYSVVVADLLAHADGLMPTTQAIYDFGDQKVKQAASRWLTLDVRKKEQAAERLSARYGRM